MAQADQRPNPELVNRRVVVGAAAFAVLGGLVLAASLATIAAIVPATADKRWVDSDRLDRRMCPSTDCGIVGQLFYREPVNVLEERAGWARITDPYDASCRDGRSEYVDVGNAECTPANGVNDGSFAEWVSSTHLTAQRPPEPGANATGTAKAVRQSDDFQKYGAAFTTAADSLVADGRCTLRDFENMGGWVKSVNQYRNQSVYYTYCGDAAANRIYLNAETGELFR